MSSLSLLSSTTTGNFENISPNSTSSGFAELSDPAIAALNPEDNLTAAKLIKLQRTASLYAGFNGKLIDENRGWRIDLIAITLSSGDPWVFHYENL